MEKSSEVENRHQQVGAGSKCYGSYMGPTGLYTQMGVEAEESSHLSLLPYGPSASHVRRCHCLTMFYNVLKEGVFWAFDIRPLFVPWSELVIENKLIPRGATVGVCLSRRSSH